MYLFDFTLIVIDILHEKGFGELSTRKRILARRRTGKEESRLLLIFYFLSAYPSISHRPRFS